MLFSLTSDENILFCQNKKKKKNFTFFYIHKKKVLDSRKFSRDLYVLRCPEHELTIFRKCLSISMCGDCISRTNAQK